MVHPCREEQTILIAVSTVMDDLEIYVVHRTNLTGYLIKLANLIDRMPGDHFLARSRGRIMGSVMLW
jgi:hypothetical protein